MVGKVQSGSRAGWRAAAQRQTRFRLPELWELPPASCSSKPRAFRIRGFFGLSGAVLVQVRLLANLYDGMVAVLRQIASPVGELFNEVPDRVSDAATRLVSVMPPDRIRCLVSLPLSSRYFSHIRGAEGKVAGAHQEFCGPMAKQQRMATVTLVAIACAIVPGATDWQVPMFALWLIIAGCIVTAIRRLQRISATLRHR